MALRRVSIPTANYSSRAGTAVRLVVLHTAQGSSNYRDLGHYFATTENDVSSHAGIDDTPGEIGVFVRRADKAWTQGKANPYSVAAELCAWAEWSAAQWGQHGAMLENAAAWVAEECAAFNIPIRRLSAAQAQGGHAGVCQHADLGAAGGGHWDCGPAFPIDDVLAMATGGRPNVPAESESEENMVLSDPKTGGVWVAYPDGAVHTLGGAPFLGASNEASMGTKGHPCIGIAADGDGDGYVLVHEFGTGQPGSRDPRSYHFGR